MGSRRLNGALGRSCDKTAGRKPRPPSSSHVEWEAGLRLMGVRDYVSDFPHAVDSPAQATVYHELAQTMHRPSTQCLRQQLKRFIRGSEIFLRVSYDYSMDLVGPVAYLGYSVRGGKRPKQTKKAMLIFTSGERASKKKSLSNVWYINWYCCKLGVGTFTC